MWAYTYLDMYNVYMGRGEIILLSTLLLTKVPRMWQLLGVSIGLRVMLG